MISRELLHKLPSRQIEYNRESTGLRWVENPDKGLRFAGFSDELLKDCTYANRGWYTDEDRSEGYAGVVYRLPSRGKRPSLVAGYAQVSFGSKRRREDDGACLDFSRVYDHEREAARAADSIAEHEAGKEREYQEAWRMGVDWSETRERIANNRREVLEILRERKAASCESFKALSKAIRSRVASLLAEREALYEKLEELAESNCYAPLRDAWRDGAGTSASSRASSR